MSESIWPLALEKYSGAGNDFILIDVRETGPPGDPSRLARALCRRGHSIGADGLIFLEEPDTSDEPDAPVRSGRSGESGRSEEPGRSEESGRSEGSGAPESGAASPPPVIRMRLWNADGSPAEISGNGARCVARWAVDHDLAGVDEEIVMATDVGQLRAWVDRDTTRLRMPTVARVWPGCRLRVEGRDLTGTYVEVGVPFFVCFHDRPEDLAVRFLGRAIRGHETLRPRGANVDFVRVEDDQKLSFRVYERGVEDETLSSGTGSIAAALAAAAADRVTSPVECVAPGATLTVRFRRRPDAGDDGDGEDEQPRGADAGRDPESAGPEPGPEEEAGQGERRRPHPSTRGPGIAFEEIEVEGDARRILRGEAFAGATRSGS